LFPPRPPAAAASASAVAGEPIDEREKSLSSTLKPRPARFFRASLEERKPSRP